MKSHEKEKDKIYTHDFKGQGQYYLSGANACTSIALSALARFSKMEDEDIKIFLGPSSKKNDRSSPVWQTLSGIVQTGVDLNKKISGGFVKTLQKKSVVEVFTALTNLPESESKLGALDQIAKFPDELVLMQGDTDAKTTLTESITNTMKELTEKYKENKLNNTEIGFIATTNGHTTAFFPLYDPNSKSTRYVSFDSGGSMFNLGGHMEIHPTLDSLSESLAKKWGNGKSQVDISVFTHNKELVKELRPPQPESIKVLHKQSK